MIHFPRRFRVVFPPSWQDALTHNRLAIGLLLDDALDNTTTQRNFYHSNNLKQLIRCVLLLRCGDAHRHRFELGNGYSRVLKKLFAPVSLQIASCPGAPATASRFARAVQILRAYGNRLLSGYINSPEVIPRVGSTLTHPTLYMGVTSIETFILNY